MKNITIIVLILIFSVGCKHVPPIEEPEEIVEVEESAVIDNSHKEFTVIGKNHIQLNDSSDEEVNEEVDEVVQVSIIKKILYFPIKLVSYPFKFLKFFNEWFAASFTYNTGDCGDRPDQFSGICSNKLKLEDK